MCRFVQYVVAVEGVHYIKPTDTRRQPVNGNHLPDFSASSQFRIQVHASCILTLTLTLTLTITIIPTSSTLSPLVHATPTAHRATLQHHAKECFGRPASIGFFYLGLPGEVTGEPDLNPRK